MSATLKVTNLVHPVSPNLPIEFAHTPTVLGVPLSSAIQVEDASSVLTSNLQRIIFTGNGVTAAYASGAVIVTVTGGSGGGGNTNLGVTTSGTSVTVTSSTGNSATINTATTSNAGVLSAADKTRINGIESLAADAAGSALVNGSHTGLAATYNSTTKTINLNVTGNNSATNLSTQYSTSSLTVLSSTGNDALINSAIPYIDSGNTGSAGVMSSMDKYQLDLLFSERGTPPLINIQNISQESGNVTVIASMHGKMIRVNTTTQPTMPIFIQNDATLNCPVGTCILFSQVGTGQLYFQADTNVVLNTSGSGIYTAKQFAKVTLTKVAADTWDLDGNAGVLV